MLQFPPPQGGIGWVSLKIMKKKQYIAPSMEVVEIELSELLASSIPDIGIEEGEGTEILSNNRRGRWGNLWPDDKK